MWIAAACLSALFAGLTAILSKCGIKNADSDVATAIRTSVVLLFAWLIVFITGAYKTLSKISASSWIFLILSGAATGASWLCYFKALSLGEVSKVAAVDKSSVVLSVLLAVAIFPDERALWWVKLICLAAIAAGTFLMTDVKRSDDESKRAWLVFALLSAAFAAATSLLAKIGIENVDSNAATAIRTCVVFVAAWLMVFCKKKPKLVKEISGKEYLFLILSGLATGATASLPAGHELALLLLRDTKRSSKRRSAYRQAQHIDNGAVLTDRVQGKALDKGVDRLGTADRGHDSYGGILLANIFLIF